MSDNIMGSPISEDALVKLSHEQRHVWAATRIAELEAEVNHLQGENDRLRDVRESRIAELEAKVDHLTALSGTSPLPERNSK